MAPDLSKSLKFGKNKASILRMGIWLLSWMSTIDGNIQAFTNWSLCILVRVLEANSSKVSIPSLFQPGPLWLSTDSQIARG